MYDKFQGTHSTGDHIRDSACYLAWAFARAYEPSIMKNYVNILSKYLITMACYDREIHCRRAAAAAFQENVGRLGNLPHGISVNTIADYWSVGLIKNSYKIVSLKIANYKEYRYHLIEHLINHKLKHWELKIRKIGGDTLQLFVKLDYKYFIDNVIPKLIFRTESKLIFDRHGALYSLSQILIGK